MQRHVSSINAETYAFGIELECYLPHTAIRDHQISIGGYSTGSPAPDCIGTPGVGWKIKHDSSLSTRRRGFKGLELVSPILLGGDGVTEAAKAASDLCRLGAKINVRAGCHVHVSVPSLLGVHPRSDARRAMRARKNQYARLLCRLLNVTSQHELALFAVTGTTGRVHGGAGDTIQPLFSDQTADRIPDMTWTDLSRSRFADCRHQGINIRPVMFDSSKPTVEFRFFQGTTSPLKVAAYIQLCLGICERATEYSTTRTPPVTQIYGDKPGKAALTRLLYMLGWVRGRRRVGKPDVDALGFVQDIATLPDLRAELRRLATKFDDALLTRVHTPHPHVDRGLEADARLIENREQQHPADIDEPPERRINSDGSWTDCRPRASEISEPEGSFIELPDEDRAEARDLMSGAEVTHPPTGLDLSHLRVVPTHIRDPQGQGYSRRR